MVGPKKSLKPRSHCIFLEPDESLGLMRRMNVGKGSSYIQRKLTGIREEVYKKENDVRLYDVRLYDINLFDEYQIKCCLN